MRARCFLTTLLLFVLAAARAPGTQPPRFLYGAAFFYERMPREQWAQALRAYRALGINTIDLYVIWNWHELRDGDYDFTGRTNPRRDLAGLLRLIQRENMRIVLRPGPVIRNEWRNGGYPAWLLKRPEYNMPLRDILEGRYAATATFQNAHSDGAAAEWMHNATHMRYATRWLRHVFSLVRPYRDRIDAVALDDDQGAYLTNDTWPGTHFHAYIRYLASVAHASLGDSMPVFINTYDMKVTASSPVWAWGTFYQSDTYRIGEHDRAQMEFATGLLQTQSPERPIMMSEFQAGWLQGADEAWPRAADPSNTTLALHTFLQMGAHGIVNFPVQDTFYPSGWEAPWSNAFYAWDAALSVQLSAQPRFKPTAQFGALMARYGDALVRTHPAADAAVAYLTSAYDPSRITNDDVSAIAQATITAQEACRTARITCALVDLRFNGARLRRYKAIVVPRTGVNLPFMPQVARTLAAYRAAGGRIVGVPEDVRPALRAAGGVPDAVLLVADNARYGFLDIVNYGDTPVRTPAALVGAGAFRAHVASLTVPARSALLLPLGIRTGAVTLPQRPQPSRGGVIIRPGSRVDLNDGFPQRTLIVKGARAIVSACAGARSFFFQDTTRGDNLLTTIGALRDAWTPEVRPSKRDYIAAYTHPIATGTFNRCYDERNATASAARYTYAAPDAPGGTARFEKTVRLLHSTNGATLDVTVIAHFASPVERAQQIASLALPNGARVVRRTGSIEIREPAQHRIVTVTWRPEAGASADVHVRAADVLLVVTYAPDRAVRVRYAFVKGPP